MGCASGAHGESVAGQKHIALHRLTSWLHFSFNPPHFQNKNVTSSSLPPDLRQGDGSSRSKADLTHAAYTEEILKGMVMFWKEASYIKDQLLL